MMRRVLYLVSLAAVAGSIFLSGCAAKDSASEADKAYKGPGASKAGAPSMNPGGSGPTSK